MLLFPLSVICMDKPKLERQKVIEDLAKYVIRPEARQGKRESYEAQIRYTYPAGLYWCEGGILESKKYELSDEMIAYIKSLSEKK